MADGVIKVQEPEDPDVTSLLQAFTNTVDGLPVKSEATTPVDPLGVPYEGQRVAASSLPVVLASDQSSVSTRPRTSDAARTSVAASTSEVELLAPNAARQVAIIYNDSTSALYVGLGSAAVTTTNFTYILGAASIWETPPGFVGEVRGLWSDATGAARVTELS